LQEGLEWDDLLLHQLSLRQGSIAHQLDDCHQRRRGPDNGSAASAADEDGFVFHDQALRLQDATYFTLDCGMDHYFIVRIGW
jgi:hypothetical protein